MLIASGLKTEKDIREYTRKLDRLQKEFEKECGYDEWQNNPADNPEFKSENLKYHREGNKGKALFNYLWRTKPSRYKKDQFCLTNVIDAQLDPQIPEAGNCLGLTMLYTLLALREKLDVSVAQSGVHIQNIVRVIDRMDNHLTSIVDNTHAEGFQTEQQANNHTANNRKNKNLTAKPASCLLSIFYSTTGAEKFENSKYNATVTDQNIALMLDPDNEDAYIYRGLVKYAKRNSKGAADDINRAIQINPASADAFYYRGLVKVFPYDESYLPMPSNRDIEEAVSDMNMAIELNPTHANAYHKRAELLKLSVEQLKQPRSRLNMAREDYRKAMELNPSLPRISFETEELNETLNNNMSNNPF